jgi:TorA maturation chaperone TorD
MSAEQTAYFQMLGSLLYNEPSIGAIDALKTNEVFSALPFAVDNKLAADGRLVMADWLESASAEELTDKARSDYVRLFIGPGKPLSPPWGSVYLSVDGLLFTEETLYVRKFYESNGRIVKEKHREPDDHIGLELEFLAYLSELGKTETALKFTEKYIVPWVFKWNADVQKHAKTGFYKALGNMTAGGVEYFMSGKPVF